MEFRIITVGKTLVKCHDNGEVQTFKKNRKWILRRVVPNKTTGYYKIDVGGKHYSIHRLILLAFYGESEQEVDHINRIKTDNRLVNLRYTDRLTNCINTSLVINAKGYHWCKSANKWRAQIKIHNKLKNVGFFDTEEEAHTAYATACEERVGLYASGRAPENLVVDTKGVSWNKHSKKWCAYIHIHNKKNHLGSFDTEEDAQNARSVAKEARDRLYKSEHSE
jgi:hypothetical protein